MLLWQCVIVIATNINLSVIIITIIRLLYDYYV